MPAPLNEFSADILGLIAEHDLEPEDACRLLGTCIAQQAQNVRNKKVFNVLMRDLEEIIFSQEFLT